MRIGIIHWGFPPRVGGVETHLVTLCPELARRGHQVFVLTETMKGVAEKQTFAGAKIIRRPELCFTNLDRWMQNKRNLPAGIKQVFEKFLEQNKISIVHAHNIHMDYFSLAGALSDTALERKIPCLAVLHNHIFIDRNQQVSKRILTELPWAKIICVSEFIKRQIIRTLPALNPEKLTVIKHGIDLNKFSPLSLGEKKKLKQKYKFSGKRIIFHPARILPWKGIIPAIRSLPKILENFPQTIMVFSGRINAIHKDKIEVSRYNQSVDNTLEQLNLDGHVHMGKYTYRDIPALTKIADVVIYTTIKEEPFGLCPVEAMACGVPVVVTNSGGLKESVIDGQTGYIIERNKKLSQQLAQRIIKLFSQPRLSQKIGQRGRQRAELHFAMQRMAADFIEISQTAIRSYSRRQ